MNKRYWRRLLCALALGALAHQASAQVQYEVSVDSGRVSVSQASKGSMADGAVWTLVTPGYRFAKLGVTIVGPQGSQLCPSASNRNTVTCRIPAFDPNQRYSYRVNVEAANASVAEPLPAPDAWVQNE